MPADAIIAAQALWAAKRWPGHKGRRAPSLESNLIVPMSPEVRRQFADGSGGELGTRNRPGKMSSLRSSSALAYNFFAPWIGTDLSPLAAALRQHVSDHTLRFEQQFRHGLSSTPPNLDVTLDNDQPRPLAIESKFTEPYGTKAPCKPLDPKYFPKGKARWAEVGLPRCQELAEQVGNGVAYMRLGVGQLLKHTLGLAYATKAAPRLVCIWYDTGCSESHEHRDELRRFAASIDEAVEFSAITYQEAFAAIQGHRDPIPHYREYLAARYFAV